MMKKCLFMLMVLAVLGLTAPANALYLAGDFNGWTSNGQEMTDNLDGTYTATVSGLDAGSRHEFKVTDGTWDWARPESGNSWLFADGSGECTVTFNTNTPGDGWLPEVNRIGLSTDPGAWTIVGDFTGWGNADPAWAMDSLGGGMYSLTKTIAAGGYNWKATVTGSWDALGWDGRSINAWNAWLELTEEAEVIFTVDAYGGMIKAEVVPEPATMTLFGLGFLLTSMRRRK